MSWLGRGLGEFGSQLGQAKDIAENWRLRQQQMALEQARQKLEESLLPLRMAEIAEIQQRIKAAGMPKVAWHQLPGGGFGYTMEKPGEEPGPLQTLQKGIPEYRDQRVGADGRLYGTNTLTGREELVPGEAITFPIPGERPEWKQTYDPSGDLRYAELDVKGQVTAWGPRVPETQAFRKVIHPDGSEETYPVDRHIKSPGTVNMSPEAQADWVRLQAGMTPAGKPGIAKTPPTKKTAAVVPPAKPGVTAPATAPGRAAALASELAKTKADTKIDTSKAPGAQATPAPTEEKAPWYKATHPGGEITKLPQLTAQQKKNAGYIRDALPLIDRVLPMMEQLNWPSKNTWRDAATERGKWFIYGLGKAQDSPYDYITQISSLLRTLVTTPYMVGMRNIDYVHQIQLHIPNPAIDTPAFMYEKLTTVKSILADMEKRSLIPILPRPE